MTRATVTKGKDSLSSVSSIAAIYGLWFVVCLSTFQLTSFLTDGANASHIFKTIIFPLSTLFFVLLASLSTSIFVVYAEPSLRRAPILRRLSVLFTMALGLVLYIVVRQTGNKGVVLFIIASANLIVFANLVGTWIVTPHKRSAELVLLCVVMSLVVIFSVFSGPTKWIAEGIKSYYESGMKGEVPVGEFFLVGIVVPGSGRLVPVLGVADWIIVTFFSAVVVKFGMNDNLAGQSLERMAKERRLSVYFPIASLGLIVAVLSAQAFDLFLPALPLIGLVFLTHLFPKYPNARNLTGQDWFLIISFTSVMGLFVIIYHMVGSFLAT